MPAENQHNFAPNYSASHPTTGLHIQLLGFALDCWAVNPTTVYLNRLPVLGTQLFTRLQCFAHNYLAFTRILDFDLNTGVPHNCVFSCFHYACVPSQIGHEYALPVPASDLRPCCKIMQIFVGPSLSPLKLSKRSQLEMSAMDSAVRELLFSCHSRPCSHIHTAFTCPCRA